MKISFNLQAMHSDLHRCTTAHMCPALPANNDDNDDGDDDDDDDKSNRMPGRIAHLGNPSTPEPELL